MVETENEIEQALVLLEHAGARSLDPPAMVVLPPDSDSFVVGNQGGLIQLAIAALKASRGEKQSFAEKSWVFESDLDWGLQGLELDESAHKYLPEKQTRLREIRNKIFGYALLFFIAGTFVTGLVTILHWLRHLVSR